MNGKGLSQIPQHHDFISPHGCHNLYFRRNHVADSICDYFAEPRRRLYFDYFALSCLRCIVRIWFVAIAISFYCIYTQTNYDIANDSTTLRPQLLNLHTLLNHNTIRSIHLTCPGTTPTPVEHLFGQPSSITSYVAFFDFAPADSFHYAATVIHFPCNGPSCSTSHTPGPYYTSTIGPRHNYLPFRFIQLLQLQRHPGFPPTTWPTAPAPAQTLTTPPHTSTRITLPHLEFFNLHQWLPRHQQFLQLPLNIRQSKQPQRFDQRRNPTKHAAQLRKLHRPPSTDAPSAPVNTPPPSLQPDLATLGSTTQQLAESVRLIQAQQQIFKNNVNSFSTRQTTDWPCTSTPPLPAATPTNAFCLHPAPESQTH